MLLIDTDVAVDIQRRHPPAILWLKTQSDPIHIAGFASLELVNGCRDKIAL